MDEGKHPYIDRDISVYCAEEETRGPTNLDMADGNGYFTIGGSKIEMRLFLSDIISNLS